MIGGVLLLAGFVVRERRASEPMLPMSFFAETLLRGHQRGLV